MSATRIGVVGAGGRMGRMLIEATLKDDQLALGAAFDVPGSPAIGKTVGDLVGMSCDVAVTDDVAAGLKTSNGKLDLYVRLQRKFAAKDEFAQLHGHLASGDLAGARLVTHTLKGVAATLGAEQLRAAAASLEQDLIAAAAGGVPDADFAARAQALEAQYADLRAALLAVLPA